MPCDRDQTGLSGASEVRQDAAACHCAVSLKSTNSGAALRFATSELPSSCCPSKSFNRIQASILEPIPIKPLNPLAINRHLAHINRTTPTSPPKQPSLLTPRAEPSKPATMSAPNAGRQSPDPERAQGKQQSDTPASDVNDQGQAASKDAPAEESKETLKNLPSNPKPILEDAAKEKTSKAT
ncbi:hypothetical protein LTR91_013357 [Friedmanniomyces endolithicus]|uniref:Uncharacterized protein n=1 Tax=Friedmanniomyces endolithicus TaxID=329885 RepID=A0AAN6FKZ6_9PEZI|nr:hypothetical protein LTS09_012221 [Friedmanniomyces endolithicus]KAK0288798.1 hypothetical protein LTR35_003197 [Friedmanniomyces endolithicus]KAK0293054.1 hypothetical protein LTS00_007655 [Friedmanniomyces endolithicus]KAK0316436.1 hypothetical protein LTR01_000184 [Friedmanniomyces endolithicus]KAK0319389.1 hypothetical protein LTR82_009454 [Friedmanniomyces endolithicus]